MIKELILHGDEEVLDCRDEIEFLRSTRFNGLLYRWSREGLVTTIPRNVVFNMLDNYGDQVRLIKSGVSPEMPAEAGRILWSQCQ